MADKKKVVRASDASMMKRLAKKYLGAELLEDMTEAEMRQRLEKPAANMAARWVVKLETRDLVWIRW